LERILKALQESFSVNGKLMSIGVSIGAAFYPDHGEEIEILVRHADAAMYRSKENGRNQITYFDQEKMGSEMV
jgi:diguanylate cyclase (GGDEF)-like protein